ncbi:MAG TPA: hypothetical protein VK610_01620 [Rhodothermales bacterium]|nr:hypothetical protein [Rhodothermales bacterium]
MANHTLPLSTLDATPATRARVIWDSRDLAAAAADLTTLTQPCAVG